MPTFPVQADDLPLQRILRAGSWRGRFFEAAANAAASIVRYSIKRQDAIGTALWLERRRFFRRKAEPYGDVTALTPM